MVWRGVAWHSKVRFGQARWGQVGNGLAGRGTDYMARLGEGWLGVAG